MLYLVVSVSEEGPPAVVSATLAFAEHRLDSLSFPEYLGARDEIGDSSRDDVAAAL